MTEPATDDRNGPTADDGDEGGSEVIPRCETCSHWKLTESDDRPDVPSQMDYEEMYADAECDAGVQYPDSFDFHDKMVFGCTLHSAE